MELIASTVAEAKVAPPFSAGQKEEELNFRQFRVAALALPVICEVLLNANIRACFFSRVFFITNQMLLRGQAGSEKRSPLLCPLPAASKYEIQEEERRREFKMGSMKAPPPRVLGAAGRVSVLGPEGVSEKRRKGFE